MDDKSSSPSNRKHLIKKGGFDKVQLSTKIGNSLKRMYEDVANEPIPDDFLKLLEQADENSKENT